MRNGASVLIDYEYDWQSRVQQFALALRSRLLHRIEHFLKRNDRDDRRDNVLVIRTTEHRFSNRERHLLCGTNDLRTADYDAAAVHFRQHLADAGIDLLELDCIGLKCAVERTVNRPEREGNQIWVFLKGLLQTLVVGSVIQGFDAAGNLEGAGETSDDVSVSLAV